MSTIRKKKSKGNKRHQYLDFFPLKSPDNNRGEQKNRLNRENRKKITEKTKPGKKPIKSLKKPTSSVQFWFYKLETEKTEPNQTQTRKNRKKTESNQKNEPKPS